MRLIDADELEKAIYEWMPKDQSTWMESDLPPIENLVVSIMMTIQEQPTVDAVPVVRCRECEYWEETSTHGRGRCWEDVPNRRFTNDEEFCSRAERREDADI